MPERIQDIVIVGGGVIGLSVAYYACRQGLSVTLLERGELGREASWAGAGIIPAGRGSGTQSPYAQLLGHSSELYPGLSEQLRAETGIDNGYRRCGGLEIGWDADDAHALRSAAGHHAKQGIAWERMTPEEARRLEPALTGAFHLAYHVPEIAQVRNPWHLRALTAACARHGVTFHTGTQVSAFELEGDRVVAVRAAEALFPAHTTVVTAGAWSGGVLETLGVSLPVQPVRGQIALLGTPPGLLCRVIMMGKEYMVPRPDGRVLVGSTEERAGFDKRPTPEGIRKLLDLAIAIAPPLASAHLEKCWAGLRPGSADSKPVIGLVPGYRGLLVATGHFRAGLQLSPVTGQIITQLILDQPPAVPLAAFRPDRFARPAQRDSQQAIGSR